MTPLASWALILALLLVAYVVIAEARGWLDDPAPQQHDDIDDTDETKDWTP